LIEDLAVLVGCGDGYAKDILNADADDDADSSDLFFEGLILVLSRQGA
jgi:hypothetical protein